MSGPLVAPSLPDDPAPPVARGDRGPGSVPDLVFPAAVVLAGAAAYSASFGGAFHFDDLPVLVENRRLDVLWPPTVAMGEGLRPLAFYSFAVNRALTGDDPGSYHAVNLALHLLAALTLYGVVRRALRLPRIAFDPGSAAATAFAAALLWVVHPLNTQAVVYIVQRAEVMAGLAGLVLLWCFLRGTETEAPGPRRRWYAAGVLAFHAGLGCKEVVATAPLTLYLLDAVLVCGSFAEPLRRRGALYAALVLPVVAVALWLTLGPDPVGFLRPAPDTLPAGDYLGAQGRVVLEYLRLAVLPVGLNFDHRFDPAEHARELFPAFAATAALAVASAAAVLRRSPVGFLGAAFFLALAPTSSLYPIADLLVEHRMYPALVPCVVVIVLGVRSLLRRAVPAPGPRRVAATGLLAAAAGALTCLTIARTEVYASPETLWSDVVAKSPGNARAHYNLGLALFDPETGGDPEGALRHFLRAAELDPAHVRARTNAGAILASRGETAAAAEQFRAALAAGPPTFDLLANHGAALMELRRHAEAREVLERALDRLDDEPSRRPRAARLRNDLGTCTALLGDLAAASEHFRHAAALDPELAGPRANLARVLAAQGRAADAVDAYLDAVRLAPGDVALRGDLARICADPGNRGAVEPRLAAALARDPADPEIARCLELVRNAR